MQRSISYENGKLSLEEEDNRVLHELKIGCQVFAHFIQLSTNTRHGPDV
jgi:hypothetical protein